MTSIETTLGALVEAEPALAKLAAVKLDAKTRYHAVKLMKLVTAETKEHFYEPREVASKELGIKTRMPTPAERALFGPDKFMLDGTPERIAAFNARLKDLSGVPVVIPWGPVTSSMLEPYPEYTGADMLALGPLCVLDEPTEKEGPTPPK